MTNPKHIQEFARKLEEDEILKRNGYEKVKCKVCNGEPMKIDVEYNKALASICGVFIPVFDKCFYCNGTGIALEKINNPAKQ